MAKTTLATLAIELVIGINDFHLPTAALPDTHIQDAQQAGDEPKETGDEPNASNGLHHNGS